MLQILPVHCWCRLPFALLLLPPPPLLLLLPQG
jgi:hypothetical protein